MPWNPKASDGSQLIARHPNIQDKYLWANGDGLRWLAKATLSKLGIKITEVCSMTGKLPEILSAILHSSSRTAVRLALEVGNNQECHDAEVERRRLSGIAIGQDPQLHVNSHKRQRKSSSVVQPKLEKIDEPLESTSTTGKVVLLVKTKHSYDLEAQVEKLSAEVEKFRNDEIGLKILLNEAKRHHEALGSEHLIEGNRFMLSNFVTSI
ncbi:hypothetical protein C8R43DRAFT_1119356 [Mycena crocata]|nr:hypothetical protein C8R43DRAFT_1119356 [Mycena crocata]